MELLRGSGAGVVIDSLNIRFKVFISKGRDFCAKLCKWLTEMGGKLADFV